MAALFIYAGSNEKRKNYFYWKQSLFDFRVAEGTPQFGKTVLCNDCCGESLKHEKVEKR